jgi:hypothetical protein
MEIPPLSAAADSKAAVYDEAEGAIHSGVLSCPGNWRLGRLGRFKKRFASIGIFCLTLKGMLF